MALPPTIPTSFVPHSSTPQRRFRTDLTGAFGFFAYAVLAAVFLLALGVFLYGRFLASSLSGKDAKLADEVSKIDQTTVENFVRLRNRLTSSSALLAKHTAFSTFFSSLERTLPTTVRFSTLRITLDPTGAARMQGSGISKNFNALAAASSAFAADGRIKDAIFSSIKINKDSSVTFSLSATLDPKIIVFSP